MFLTTLNKNKEIYTSIFVTICHSQTVLCLQIYLIHSHTFTHKVTDGRNPRTDCSNRLYVLVLFWHCHNPVCLENIVGFLYIYTSHQSIKSIISYQLGAQLSGLAGQKDWQELTMPAHQLCCFTLPGLSEQPVAGFNLCAHRSFRTGRLDAVQLWLSCQPTYYALPLQ